jgi:hypothetical protein
MYYVKTRATKELAHRILSGRGRTARAARRTTCSVGSLVTAQQLARMLGASGLLR